MGTGTVFFVNCSPHPIRIARQTLEYNYNMRANITVSKTLTTLDGRPTPDSVATQFHVAALSGDVFEISCYSVGFEDTVYVAADRHQVAIITDNVQIMDARTFFQVKTGPKPKAQTVGVVTSGPRKLPVYRYRGQRDDTTSFLFEVEVDAATIGDMGVPEFKAVVAAKMLEIKGVDVAARNLRLCAMGGAVFRDNQRLHQVFGGCIVGSEKIGLTVLDEPEDLPEGCKVISAIRYYPESFTLSDDHLEITLETTGYDVSALRIRNAIAQALGPGGLSADQLSVACNETAPGTKTGTAADMRLMDWDYRNPLRLCQDNCLVRTSPHAC
jgi:hypothetical protein